MPVIHILISFLCALVATWWIYPKALLLAKKKNVVDNPNERKLQRTPVPILGGATVVFGIIVGIGCSLFFVDLPEFLPILIAIIIILYAGMLDDNVGLSPQMRFFLEIAVVVFLIYSFDHSLNHFHGLWERNLIPPYIAVPLTVFACVGIINAINLIDGVDGYSSGYCIMACGVFGLFFYFAGDTAMVTLAAVSIGSLVPFFLHNVFGKKSKMFIGDGGSLVLGVIMSVFVIYVLCSDTMCNVFVEKGAGLVSFALAVLCIPVFDTIRVMSTRIMRGKSPFIPDKTHLHHLFIDLGFSHIGAVISILVLNLFVILCWWIAYRLGVSIDGQLYTVVVLGVLETFVLYKFMRVQIARNTVVYRAMRKVGEVTHFEREGVFLWLQKIMDKDASVEPKEE
jgi:UDP-N-acetylmuramyl pentapeptide phosphotransferase/UDP-N-acetylglucosamine-1-phosphate transferase